MNYRCIIFCFNLILLSLSAMAQDNPSRVIFSGCIRDTYTKEGLPFATIQLKGLKSYATVADTEGEFKLTDVQTGNYEMVVSFLGYGKQHKNITLKQNLYLTVNLRSENQLNEVVITATESRGITSSSRIDRPAMAHLQPTSFTDLLELLPGGISKDPNMGAANSVQLRETGNLGATGEASDNPDYAITSLGTQFVIDGVPVNTDANLQYSPIMSSNTSESRRNITNKGVDMRSISTDDIESVEIVRGIPSVEYGNLTSGLINIKRIRKVSRLNARFKADGYSKLFSAGKGFAIPGQDLIVNVDGGYLDSKTDPRNKLENYKRANASLRLTWKWQKEGWILEWAPGLDYTGSFDNVKVDPDLNYGATDKFKSTYNKTGFSSNLKWKFPKIDFIKSVELNSALNMQFDKLEMTKLVSPTRYALAPTSVEEGEHDAQLLFSEYIADYLSDGKPLNGFIKLKGDFSFKPFKIKNDLKIGGEWNYSKNLGKGQVYDLSHPIGLSNWSTRPRAYKDIPALQHLSFFFEDYITYFAGQHKLELLAGVRSISMIGMDKAYLLQGKIYLDPRMNAQWSFPGISIAGRKLEIALAGGIGWTTKMPTLDYLYPNKHYNDIIQLGYYDVNKPAEYSRFNMRTYVEDVTNYNLKPARNKKWEVRADFNYNGNRLSVNYFREEMTSGFRYSSFYAPYIYKDYDESAIASSGLQAPPRLEDIPYVETERLDGYKKAENGSKLKKEGVELQFNSQRIKPLRTAIYVSGAWFKSTYTNSLPMYDPVSTVVDNTIIRDKYVGLYDWNDGRVNQQLNTNIMLDTQVPEWGLIFSTSVQCMWFIKTQRLYQNGTPVSYLDVSDGQLHPYTAESASDKFLQHLTQAINEDAFKEYKIPTACYINFKATKKIGKYLSLAFFANKLLDYTPDFKSNGQTIRRNVDPYFGMELNFNL